MLPRAAREKQAQPESGPRAPLSWAGTAALPCEIKQCALPARSRLPAALSEADGTDDRGPANRRDELDQAVCHVREEAQQLRPPSVDLAQRNCDREVGRQRSGREEYSYQALTSWRRPPSPSCTAQRADRTRSRSRSRERRGLSAYRSTGSGNTNREPSARRAGENARHREHRQNAGRASSPHRPSDSAADSHRQDEGRSELRRDRQGLPSRQHGCHHAGRDGPSDDRSAHRNVPFAGAARVEAKREYRQLGSDSRVVRPSAKQIQLNKRMHDSSS